MSNYYVEYKIPGMTGDTLHRQGPYGLTEAQQHRDDIGGFSGVTECQIVKKLNFAQCMERADFLAGIAIEGTPYEMATAFDDEVFQIRVGTESERGLATLRMEKLGPGIATSRSFLTVEGQPNIEWLDCAAIVTRLENELRVVML